MNHVTPVILPSLGAVGSPQSAYVPTLMHGRAFGSADTADVAARYRQRPQHLRPDARKLFHVFTAVELEGTIGAILAVASDEIMFLGGLILRRIPIVDAPVNAHATEITAVINIFDFLADNLFGEQLAQLSLAAPENLKVVMEGVVVGILAGFWIQDLIRQLDNLAPYPIVRQLN